MKAYKAEELRAFTGALFRSERFDAFLLCEASFRTAFSLEIDGRRNKDWYSAEEEQELGAEDFVRWGEVRELAFQAIRGKKAPGAPLKPAGEHGFSCGEREPAAPGRGERLLLEFAV